MTYTYDDLEELAAEVLFEMEKSANVNSANDAARRSRRMEGRSKERQATLKNELRAKKRMREQGIGRRRPLAALAEHEQGMVAHREAMAQSARDAAQRASHSAPAAATHAAPSAAASAASTAAKKAPGFAAKHWKKGVAGAGVIAAIAGAKKLHDSRSGHRKQAGASLEELAYRRAVEILEDNGYEVETE